jgi:phage terminase large subunit
VRALLADPPAVVAGRVSAFCDFAGPGDESVLAVCEGNSARIVEAWRHRDTMHSVGKFVSLFRKLGLNGYQIGGDEGYGHQLMDRMAEQGYYLKRVNNGVTASKPNLYANLAAEWWSTVGELVERRKIILPKGDEKLVAQLTSRQKLYDSKGRERLESKADMRARGLESPDRADALIGAIMLGVVGQRGAITMADIPWITFGGPSMWYESVGEFHG